MTNAQLFFSAGFPTLVIVIGFIWQGSRFSDRLDAFQKQVDVRFALVQEQLTQLNARVSVIEGDLRQFYRDLGRHEKAIERLESKGN